MTAEATNAELVRMFRRELELCKVEEGQTVAIYSEGGQRPNYAEAFAHAATDLGRLAILRPDAATQRVYQMLGADTHRLRRQIVH